MFLQLVEIRPLRLFEAENRMSVIRDELPNKEIADFRTRNFARQKYRVAARFWAQGMTWQRAREIAEDAFNEVPAAMD